MRTLGLFAVACLSAMGVSRLFQFILPLWLAIPMALIIGVLAGQVVYHVAHRKP